jgi:hypothetical protein
MTLLLVQNITVTEIPIIIAAVNISFDVSRIRSSIEQANTRQTGSSGTLIFVSLKLIQTEFARVIPSVAIRIRNNDEFPAPSVTPTRKAESTVTDATLATAWRRAVFVAIDGRGCTWTVILTNVVGKQLAEVFAVPGRANVPSRHGALGSAPPGQYRPAGQGMHC